MTKRRFVLHVGLDDASGDVVAASLDKHRHALAELGIRCPAESPEEIVRGAAEMLLAHRHWGLEWDDVDGSWTRMVERGRKGRDTLVLSAPQLAAADPARAALALDALAGFEVHLLVTVAPPDAWTLAGDSGRDLGSVLDRWTSVFHHRDRTHVVVAEDDAAVWRSLGRIAGFGTNSVPAVARSAMRIRPSRPQPVDRRTVAERLAAAWAEQLREGGFVVHGDLAALAPEALADPPPPDLARDLAEDLAAALAEVERLTRRNDVLEAKIARLRLKKARLKDKLAGRP